MSATLRSAIVTLLAAAAITACGKPAPTKPVAPAAPPPVVEAPPPAVDEPPSSMVPADLPPVAATADADPAKATELVDAVVAQLQEGAPPEEVVADALAAVRANPGSGRARILLASLVEDEAFKAAQIEAVVSATDCADCTDAILNMTRSDWPDAVGELAARVTASPQRKALDAILTFIASGDGAIAGYFKGKKVVLDTSCLSCEMSGEGDASAKPKTLTGKKALAWVKAGQARGAAGEKDALYALDEWYCEADCCHAAASLQGMPNGNTFLTAVCFAKGTDQVASLVVFD